MDSFSFLNQSISDPLVGIIVCALCAHLKFFKMSTLTFIKYERTSEWVKAINEQTDRKKNEKANGTFHMDEKKKVRIKWKKKQQVYENPLCVGRKLLDKFAALTWPLHWHHYHRSEYFPFSFFFHFNFEAIDVFADKVERKECTGRDWTGKRMSEWE